MQAKWILPLFRLSHPLRVIRLPKIPTIRPIHIHQLLPDPLHHLAIQANRGRRAIHQATPNRAVKTRLLSVV
jgi:hypothetical protein